MPIKGLTEKRSLARIGKIHLGVKQKNKGGNLYPTATDYFVVYEDGNTSPEIVAKFKALYGEKPKELNIMFPVNDPEIFFPQWLKRYGNNRLLCKGDGEKAFETDSKTGEIREIECKYRNCPYYQKGQCKEVGNLLFYVQGIPEGVFQIDTSSTNSIKKINTAIDIIKSANGGKIAGIPLKLALVPMKVLVEGKYNKTVYILHLYQPNAAVNPPTAEEEKDVDELINEAVDEMENEDFTFPPEEEIDEVPEDLFPEEVQNDESKYGPLTVTAVKGFYNKDGTTFYVASLKDVKGNQYTMVVPEEFKELKDTTIKNYTLEETKLGNKLLEKIADYEVAM